MLWIELSPAFLEKGKQSAWPRVRRFAERASPKIDKALLWFVALAPVEQPRLAIAGIVEYGGEGSRGALPVARQVLAAALGVQP